jgi:hypothetical protein
LHVDDESADTSMLGGVGVCSGKQESEVGDVRVGRPNFLAADQPRVAVALCLGPQRCEIASRLRFAEKLTPQVIEPPNPGKVVPLLLRGAVAQQRARDQVVCADRPGRLGVGEFAVEDEVLQRVMVGPPTPFFGPVRADESRVEQARAPLAILRQVIVFGAACSGKSLHRRTMRRDVSADAVAVVGQLVIQLEIHQPALTT